MISRDTIVDDYFEWLYRIVAPPNTPTYKLYRRLLTRLHDVDFKVIIPRDQNRAEDGISMRHRFALELSDDQRYILSVMDMLDGPCSVFEMMVSLAIHCEDFMDDTAYGDRTGQWFWTMVLNLGLGMMTNDRFDNTYVDEKLDIFLERKYSPDGHGGLFTIPDCERDLRDVEIWHQMCWYLNTIT